MRSRLRKGANILLFLSVVFGAVLVTAQANGTYDTPNDFAPSYFDSVQEQNSQFPNEGMHPDSDTLHEWIELYHRAPLATIEPKIALAESGSYNLLNHLQYIPSERDQGYAENCWVWAGTGVLEIALDVQTGTKDRLSIQYFDSNYNGGTGSNWAGCGGSLSDFAQFYSPMGGTGLAISWSNTNAAYGDYYQACGSGGAAVPASSISTWPRYTITSCAEQSIPNTHGAAQSAVIASIKNILDQNKAVWFCFFLPNAADWDVFQNYWNNQAESVKWSPDYSNGHTWVNGEGTGHAVLCLGYDDTDPNNRYWVMVNSWGTAGGGRPNGIFRLNMNINYDCVFYDPYYLGYFYSLYWETLDVSFNWKPAITSLSADKSSPQLVGATITWTCSASDPDDVTLYYRFWKLKQGGTWVMVQDWSTSNTYTWVTSSSDVGGTLFGVWVRDGYHAGPTAGDAYANSGYYFQIMENVKPTISSLQTDQSSPRGIGATIVWICVASDPEGDTLQYRFWKLKQGGSWVMVQDWSTSNAYSWVTTSADIGGTLFGVWVRDGYHAGVNAADVCFNSGYYFQIVNVKPSISSLSADKASPQQVGATIV